VEDEGTVLKLSRVNYLFLVIIFRPKRLCLFATFINFLPIIYSSIYLIGFLIRYVLLCLIFHFLTIKLLLLILQYSQGCGIFLKVIRCVFGLINLQPITILHSLPFFLIWTNITAIIIFILI
jgi:hypothetical protein